ncbi:MAG TPA: hypothetical protein DCF62_13145 [Porticoccaceae bacterium]|nr:hypothetical protein [Porticoccaceae bacterium]HCO60434.1 hypothetical protein [Porticoccaceae bacterium]
MINELVFRFASWLDTFESSTNLHESLYMYGWVESTHVLTLSLFLGMLLVIDLRLLGWGFTNIPASTLLEKLDKPMMIGFVIMVITGVLLYYAIPVRSSQSIFFRVKLILLIAAGINAFLIRQMTHGKDLAWDGDPRPPSRIRVGAGLSLTLWALIVAAGRMMAYDWWDCHKDMPNFMYWAAGCVNELAAMEQ